MSTSILAIVHAPALDWPAASAFTFADPADAQLSVLDLAATRGDGIFETVSAGNGHLQALEPHLARFARSAAMLDLPQPDLDTWRDAMHAAITQLDPAVESWVKIVMTRGIEGGDGRPTGWAFATHSDNFSELRSVGLRVITLDRGVRHDVARTAPWLLFGAKTLSYAINRSVVREAARRGADDTLFVSSDGYLLEGPSSNLLIKSGNALVTPRTDLGILTGTTQVSIFDWAAAAGFTTSYELLTGDDLASADAAWLVSSVRHAVPIRSVDGRDIPVDTKLTDRINEFLIARTA